MAYREWPSVVWPSDWTARDWRIMGWVVVILIASCIAILGWQLLARYRRIRKQSHLSRVPVVKQEPLPRPQDPEDTQDDRD